MERLTITRNPAHTDTDPVALRSLAVIGLGYVGLPLAILADERGFRVRGFDTDPDKIRTLRAREAPFLTKDELASFQRGTFDFSEDDSVLRETDAYIICVPTPVDETHEPDLRPLTAAAKSIGRHLRKGSLVIIESTVDPGACERVVLPVLMRESGLSPEQDFLFAHCPERINPGDTAWSVRTIPRVVGGIGPKSLAAATALYRSLLDAPIKAMGSMRETEAVKMVENAFRDVNIAFANELAMSFARGGIDIVNVLNGAATKPFGFMPHFPGCGVGGHCIPVDPYYLIRYGHENGFEHRFLATARLINNDMPRYTVDLLERALQDTYRQPIAETTVALLGLAYKRDVPDLRESPALAIQDELVKRGAQVHIFDPFVPRASTHTSLDDTLQGARAAIVATDHSIFRTLTPEDFASRGIAVLVDGRNCLPKDAFVRAGITYRGIGR